jgi:hypothetical protein
MFEKLGPRLNRLTEYRHTPGYFAEASVTNEKKVFIGFLTSCRKSGCQETADNLGSGFVFRPFRPFDVELSNFLSNSSASKAVLASGCSEPSVDVEKLFFLSSSQTLGRNKLGCLFPRQHFLS